MAVKVQFRRDTAANWESNNTVLSQGELGLDTTNQRFKIGDGVTAWNSIEFSQYTNKAETFLATTTLAGSDGTSDWSQESSGDWNGIWTVTKTVSGILTTDTPIVDLDLSNATGSTYQDIQLGFSFVIRAEIISNNNIKFYAISEPSKDLVLNIKVVR